MRGQAVLTPVISLGLLAQTAVAPPSTSSDYTPVQSCPGGVCLGAASPGSPGEQTVASATGGPATVLCFFGPVPAAESAQLDLVSLHPGQQGGWFYRLPSPCRFPDGRAIRWPGPVWLASAGPGGPAQLAQEAYRLLPVPLPGLQVNPPASQRQFVHLPTWLWVDPASWGARTATVSVPGESVTATATPVAVAWSMGDGHTVVCHGPGTAYDPQRPMAAQRPTCAYTYQRSSADQPDGRFTVSATAAWAVTWQATGGTAAGGQLPPLRRTAQLSLSVAEAQALN